MASKVGKIDRKAGKLYFVKKNGDVMETELNTKGGKKGRTVVRKNKCTQSKADLPKKYNKNRSGAND